MIQVTIFRLSAKTIPASSAPPKRMPSARGEQVHAERRDPSLITPIQPSAVQNGRT